MTELQPSQQGERSPKREKSHEAMRQNIYEVIDSESLDISLGHVKDFDKIVTMTLQVLTFVLRRSHWTVPNALISEIRRCGEIMQRRNPLRFEIGNTVLRVMRFIRRAAMAICRVHDGDSSRASDPSPVAAPLLTPSPRMSPAEGFFSMDPDMRSSLSASRVLADDLEKPYMLRQFDKNMRSQMRDLVSTSIADFEEQEVTAAVDSLSEKAHQHVHPNECILVYGYSKTVLRFLTVVRQHGVKFEVLVAESAPRHDGQDMTVDLVKAGITATLVPDSALYVMMPRVSKVIVGAHAIMSNGGILAASGVHLAAVAARKHGVPLMVCSSLIKLTPRYPYDLEFLSCLSNPADVIPHTMLEHPENVSVLNPCFDYVPPEYVSLFVTDHGYHTPSFIYRLLEEYYDAEDYQFSPL